jgi:integrase
MGLNNSGKRQVCAVLMEAKNLTEVEPLKSGLAGATKASKDVAEAIFNYSWWMMKQGYKSTTMDSYRTNMRLLDRKGANFFDPESVKETIARQKDWSNATKANMVTTYSNFLRFFGTTWIPPRYRRTEKLPFIPLEKEIDQLIAGCSKIVATFLQILKETGCRSVEAWNLTWNDVDLKRNTLKLASAKYGKPKEYKISGELISMLKALRGKHGSRVFAKYIQGFANRFRQQRKKIAEKLKNPRIQRISFHTFRHWKGTTLYHKTKDLRFVQDFLRHSSIESTVIYTHLVDFKTDEFHVKVAKNLDEVCELGKQGFEYFTIVDSCQVFRKRK